MPLAAIPRSRSRPRRPPSRRRRSGSRGWQFAPRRCKGCRARGSRSRHGRSPRHCRSPPRLPGAAWEASPGSSSVRRVPRRRATRRPRTGCSAPARIRPSHRARRRGLGRAQCRRRRTRAGGRWRAPSPDGPGRAAAHHDRRRTTRRPSARHSGPRPRRPPAAISRTAAGRSTRSAACCGSSATVTSPSGPATILCDLTPMCSSSSRRGAFWTV